ncbi:MAG: RNA-directed DNA polymerase [Rhodanobacteraceae bacterium]|nr:MAG: RNA-directed DNA polymerase [Rhodanobacteraceae bacterium]
MAKSTTKRTAPAARSVLDLSARQARAFFLQPGSYFSLDLPPYFDFAPVLTDVATYLARRDLSSLSSKPRECDNVNYTIYSNKDGRYAWRPFRLIHPAMYVDLVNVMTEPDAWAQLRARFKKFSAVSNVDCLSIPQQSRTKRSNRAAQILRWWQGVEQASIELALDFEYVLQTDVTDCYPSIYTHSIAWSIHGKSVAKANQRDHTLLGNVVDRRLQDMQQGQTNGIPQGSVLMDFLAEIVLGYADFKLGQRLAKARVSDFRILRYRDDYRIFVNDSQAGDLILRALSEVLQGLGMKLNAPKTTGAQAVIASSVKRDKLAWLRGNQYDKNLQKHLLLIHAHGREHPNAGSLVASLTDFYRRLPKQPRIEDPMPMMSMAVDIGASSPRCFPTCAAIVSKLLSALPAAKKLAVLERIRGRLDRVPNNGHLEVWLQRISHPITPDVAYDEPLCRLVEGEDVALWNDSWITDRKLQRIVDASRVIDRKRLDATRPLVRRAEFSVFEYP